MRRRRAWYDLNVPESGPPAGPPPRPARRPQAEAMPGPFHALARYNGERARGLVHTPEWDERMAALQAEFDEWASNVRLPDERKP